MNSISVIYTQEVFNKNFNVYGDVNNPLFLAKDVAEMIEHSDVSMMLKKIDEDEKLLQTLFVAGQNREMWFLTEDGLYEVLMQSRKPIAKQFKKKVKEILKGLRRGELKIMSNELSNIDMQTLAQSIVESNNNTAACMQQMTQMMGVMLQLLQNNNTNINTNTTSQTETQTEKEYIDSCVGPVTGKFYTMSDIAKAVTKETDIICDAKKLNRFLCANDIIMRTKGYEYNKQIHNNIYILTEQYRDTYDTLITPGIKKYTDEFYLSNVYRGNFRQFVISTVKNNIEKFINS